MIKFENKRIDRKKHIVNASQGKKVLDIGCVGADGLVKLHTKIKEVSSECVGLDIVESEGVVKGDAQDFFFDDEFDLIVCSEVVEHLYNVEGFFKSAIQNLKLNGGGRLIVTTPNPYSALMLRKAVIGAVVPNDRYHINLFDVTTFQNWINNFCKDHDVVLDGTIKYYEDWGELSFPYKVNKFLSGFVYSYSVGIILDCEIIV